MKYLLIVFMVGLMSCSAKNPTKALTSKYEEQARLCVAKFKDVARVKLPKEIDRAYLHQGKDFSDILFTHGRLGTFSDRDDDYQAYIACRIENNEPYRVYRLKHFYDELLPDDADLSNNANLYESTVIEVLLIKNGTGFEFFRQQIFSEDNMD